MLLSSASSLLLLTTVAERLVADDALRVGYARVPLSRSLISRSLPLVPRRSPGGPSGSSVRTLASAIGDTRVSRVTARRRVRSTTALMPREAHGTSHHKMASPPRRCVALYGTRRRASSTLQRDRANRRSVPRGFPSTTMATRRTVSRCTREDRSNRRSVCASSPGAPLARAFAILSSNCRRRSESSRQLSFRGRAKTRRLSLSRHVESAAGGMLMMLIPRLDRRARFGVNYYA